MNSLEENKHRVLGDKKRKKNLAGHELCEDLLKEEIWGYILIVSEDLLWRIVPLLMKEARYSPGITFKSLILFRGSSALSPRCVSR